MFVRKNRRRYSQERTDKNALEKMRLNLVLTFDPENLDFVLCKKKDGFDTAENEPSEILFLYFNIPRFENQNLMY